MQFPWWPSPLVGQISVPALAGIMVQVSLDTIQFKPTLDAFKTAFEGKEEDANVRLESLSLLRYSATRSTSQWGFAQA